MTLKVFKQTIVLAIVIYCCLPIGGVLGENDDDYSLDWIQGAKADTSKTSQQLRFFTINGEKIDKKKHDSLHTNKTNHSHTGKWKNQQIQKHTSAQKKDHLNWWSKPKKSKNLPQKPQQKKPRKKKSETKHDVCTRRSGNTKWKTQSDHERWHKKGIVHNHKGRKCHGTGHYYHTDHWKKSHRKWEKPSLPAPKITKKICIKQDTKGQYKINAAKHSKWHKNNKYHQHRGKIDNGGCGGQWYINRTHNKTQMQDHSKWKNKSVDKKKASSKPTRNTTTTDSLGAVSTPDLSTIKLKISLGINVRVDQIQMNGGSLNCNSISNEPPEDNNSIYLKCTKPQDESDESGGKFRITYHQDEESKSCTYKSSSEMSMYRIDKDTCNFEEQETTSLEDLVKNLDNKTFAIDKKIIHVEINDIKFNQSIMPTLPDVLYTGDGEKISGDRRMTLKDKSSNRELYTKQEKKGCRFLLTGIDTSITRDSLKNCWLSTLPWRKEWGEFETSNDEVVCKQDLDNKVKCWTPNRIKSFCRKQINQTSGYKLEFPGLCVSSDSPDAENVELYAAKFPGQVSKKISELLKDGFTESTYEYAIKNDDGSFTKLGTNKKLSSIIENDKQVNNFYSYIPSEFKSLPTHIYIHIKSPKGKSITGCKPASSQWDWTIGYMNSSKGSKGSKGINEKKYSTRCKYQITLKYPHALQDKLSITATDATGNVLEGDTCSENRDDYNFTCKSSSSAAKLNISIPSLKALGSRIVESNQQVYQLKLDDFPLKNDLIKTILASTDRKFYNYRFCSDKETCPDEINSLPTSFSKTSIPDSVTLPQYVEIRLKDESDCYKSSDPIWWDLSENLVEGVMSKPVAKKIPITIESINEEFNTFTDTLSLYLSLQDCKENQNSSIEYNINSFKTVSIGACVNENQKYWVKAHRKQAAISDCIAIEKKTPQNNDAFWTFRLDKIIQPEKIKLENMQYLLVLNDKALITGQALDYNELVDLLKTQIRQGTHLYRLDSIGTTAYRVKLNDIGSITYSHSNLPLFTLINDFIDLEGQAITDENTKHIYVLTPKIPDRKTLKVTLRYTLDSWIKSDKFSYLALDCGEYKEPECYQINNVDRLKQIFKEGLQ